MNFQTMSKEEYYNKYGVGVRFLFGYDNFLVCDKEDEFQLNVRTIVPKKYFEQYKNINIFQAMDLFKKTPIFEQLIEQTIEIDFEKQEFVKPVFFIKHNIEIIPYFSQGIEAEKNISKEKFFELLKQNEVKELNYLCFLFFGSFCKEEYEYFYNQELLSGGALAIYEILIALLIGEENEWKEKQKEFMKNVLKLMVYKRDNEKDFIFDLSTLTNVISLQSLLKLAIDYKDKAKENVGIMDFVKYISSAIEVDINDFLKGDKNDENWIKEMYKKTQGKGQGVYDVSVCIVAWRNVLTNLSSDYRKQKKSS
nr:hypothetical protein [Campylobacter jejuni]